MSAPSKAGRMLINEIRLLEHGTSRVCKTNNVNSSSPEDTFHPVKVAEATKSSEPFLSININKVARTKRNETSPLSGVVARTPVTSHGTGHHGGRERARCFES